jgi:MFS family permease
MLGLALVHGVPMAFVLLLGLGLTFSLFTASANALVQLSSPPHLRGRVMSLYLFAFAGLAPVGGLVAGWLAEEGGTPLAFSVAGVAGLLVITWATYQLFGEQDSAERRPAAGIPASRGANP